MVTPHTAPKQLSRPVRTITDYKLQPKCEWYSVRSKPGLLSLCSDHETDKESVYGWISRDVLLEKSNSTTLPQTINLHWLLPKLPYDVYTIGPAHRSYKLSMFTTSPTGQTTLSIIEDVLFLRVKALTWWFELGEPATPKNDIWLKVPPIIKSFVFLQTPRDIEHDSVSFHLFIRALSMSAMTTEDYTTMVGGLSERRVVIGVLWRFERFLLLLRLMTCLIHIIPSYISTIKPPLWSFQRHEREIASIVDQQQQSIQAKLELKNKEGKEEKKKKKTADDDDDDECSEYEFDYDARNPIDIKLRKFDNEHGFMDWVKDVHKPDTLFQRWQFGEHPVKNIRPICAFLRDGYIYVPTTAVRVILKTKLDPRMRSIALLSERDRKEERKSVKSSWLEYYDRMMAPFTRYIKRLLKAKDREMNPTNTNNLTLEQLTVVMPPCIKQAHTTAVKYNMRVVLWNYFYKFGIKQVDIIKAWRPAYALAYQDRKRYKDPLTGIINETKSAYTGMKKKNYSPYSCVTIISMGNCPVKQSQPNANDSQCINACSNCAGTKGAKFSPYQQTVAVVYDNANKGSEPIKPHVLLKLESEPSHKEVKCYCCTPRVLKPIPKTFSSSMPSTSSSSSSSVVVDDESLNELDLGKEESIDDLLTGYIEEEEKKEKEEDEKTKSNRKRKDINRTLFNE